MRFRFRGLAVAIAAVAGFAAPSVRAAEPILIPAGTSIQIEIVDLLSSETAATDAAFRLRLAFPIIVNGVTLVPAGVMGGGEVINAQKSRFGGKPGELTLAARYLDYNGTRLRLRGLKMTSAGQDRLNEALVAGLIFSPLALVITGGKVEVPAGSTATVLLAADVTVEPPQTMLPAAAPAPETPSTTPAVSEKAQ